MPVSVGVPATTESHSDQERLFAVDSVVAGAPTETGKAGEGLRGFVEGLEAIRADSSRMRLRDLIAKALEFSGLMDAYQNDKEDSDRVENLKELVNAASAFEARARRRPREMRPLDAFLAHAALEAGSHGAEENQSAGADDDGPCGEGVGIRPRLHRWS